MAPRSCAFQRSASRSSSASADVPEQRWFYRTSKTLTAPASTTWATSCCGSTDATVGPADARFSRSSCSAQGCRQTSAAPCGGFGRLRRRAYFRSPVARSRHGCRPAWRARDRCGPWRLQPARPVRRRRTPTHRSRRQHGCTVTPQSFRSGLRHRRYRGLRSPFQRGIERNASWGELPVALDMPIAVQRRGCRRRPGGVTCRLRAGAVSVREEGPVLHVPSVALSPVQIRPASFVFAEAHFVGDEQPNAAGFEDEGDRAELVRPKHGAGGAEGVGGVSRLLPELRPSQSGIRASGARRCLSDRLAVRRPGHLGDFQGLVGNRPV